MRRIGTLSAAGISLAVHSWRRRPQDQHQVPSCVAHVANPLGLPPRGDEILRSVDGQQVHGNVVQLAGGPAPVLQDT